MRCVLLLLMLLASAAQARSIFIEDLTWPEISDAIRRGTDTAIYYAGSTEQNGPHMVTGKHNIIARHVAANIAVRLGKALVYPIMPYAPTGDILKKSGHMRYPGSVSLSESTYVAVAADVAASARAAGFKRILLMADHGEGQAALGELAKRLTAEWRTEKVRVIHILDVYERSAELEGEALLKKGLEAGGHAALADTSALLFLDRNRRWVRRNAIDLGNQANGVDGSPKRSSSQIGGQLIKLKVESALNQIRREFANSGD